MYVYVYTRTRIRNCITSVDDHHCTFINTRLHCTYIMDEAQCRRSHREVRKNKAHQSKVLRTWVHGHSRAWGRASRCRGWAHTLHVQGMGTPARVHGSLHTCMSGAGPPCCGAGHPARLGGIEQSVLSLQVTYTR